MKICILIKLVFFLSFFSSKAIKAQNYIFYYDPVGGLVKKTIVGQGLSIAISGQSTICLKDTLQWVASGGQSYQWSTGSQTPSLSSVPSQSGQFTVTVTAANGCTGVKSKSFTVNPKPVLGFIQQTSPQGTPGPATYATTNISGANYYWLASGGSILNGQGTAEVQVSWSTGNPPDLMVYAISAAGCNSDTVTFNPAGATDQFIPLNTGWNLVSTYLSPVSYSAHAVFGELEQQGVLNLVKTIDKLYTPGIPAGLNTLQNIEDGAGYWVQANQPSSWHVSGMKLNPGNTPILIHPGWNLIGYLPNHSLPVEQALASITPQVEFVKNIFNSFDPAAPPIFNTLTDLEPGQGYWVKSNAPAILIYPNDNFSGGGVTEKLSNSDEEWKSKVIAYPNSMAAYGIVTLNGQSVDDGKIIFASIGNEVRAVGKTILYGGQSYVTLVVNGDVTESVQFHMIEGTDTLTSSFQCTLLPGSEFSGFMPLEFGKTSNSQERISNKFCARIYPNPTSQICFIDFLSDEENIFHVSLQDLNGRQLPVEVTELPSFSKHRLLLLDLNNVVISSGFYVVTLQSKDSIFEWKLIVERP